MFHSGDEHTGLSFVESLDHKSQNTSTKIDLSITDIGCIKKGGGRKVTERKTTIKGTMKVTNSSERKEMEKGGRVEE